MGHQRIHPRLAYRLLQAGDKEIRRNPPLLYQSGKQSVARYRDIAVTQADFTYKITPNTIAIIDAGQRAPFGN
jgi:hypothetical protein